MIYNYITTNKINGKQYVGMHSTKNVDDSYLGSGKGLLQAIKKYGRCNFTRKCLCVCKTMEEAYINETIFIEKYATLSPNGYNISPAGGLGFHESFSEEIRQTMRNNHADYSGENHPMFGRTHSEESKKKNSETKKRFYQTEEGLKAIASMSESKKGKAPPNKGKSSPNKGKKRPKEVGDKIANSLKGKGHSEERNQKNRESQLKYMSDPVRRENARQKALLQWQNSEWRENHTGENYRKGIKKTKSSLIY